MATAVVLKFQGGNLDEHDSVMTAADMEGKPASFISGLQFHLVHPIDGGLRSSTCGTVSTPSTPTSLIALDRP